jgi:hypothetical protein
VIATNVSSDCYKRNGTCFEFSYVCPESVLVK